VDAQALSVWRGSLLLIMAAECCVQTGAAFWLGSFRPESFGGVYGLVARSALLTVLLTTLTVVALWRFLGPRASLAAGIVALVGMKLAGETFARVFTVHHQDFYQGGAMLAGAVIGEAYARIEGVQPDRSRAGALEARRFGMTGALGMLAGSYVAAGTSKLLGGGLGWATSSAIRLMVMAHTEVEGGFWSVGIPHRTAANPYVCMALEVGTLLVQLGAFMLLVGPLARRLWALLIVAFHVGIYLTSHILFLSPLLFAAVVAIPWARLLPRRSDTDDPGEMEQEANRPATRPFFLALLALGEMLALRLSSSW